METDTIKAMRLLEAEALMKNPMAFDNYESDVEKMRKWHLSISVYPAELQRQLRDDVRTRILDMGMPFSDFEKVCEESLRSVTLAIAAAGP